MQSESETAWSKNNSLRSRAKEVGLEVEFRDNHFLSAGGLGQWNPELHQGKSCTGGTKAVSSNMWTETGQGNLLSYSTLGNTWVLGIISHNPSGLSPDTPQVPDLGKGTRALFPSQKSRASTCYQRYISHEEECGQVSGRREGWILN